MVQLAALALRPSTFDPAGALQAAQGIQSGQIRNRLAEMELAMAPERNRITLESLRLQGDQARTANTLAQLQLGQQQRRDSALTDFGARGGLGNTASLSALVGQPDLYTQALSGMDAAQRMNVARNARDAQYVLGLLGNTDEWTPQARSAWQSRLDAARQEGRISPEQHEQLSSAAQPPRLMLNSVVRMGQAVPTELEAAHAELYRAQADAARAQQGQRQFFARLLTGGGNTQTTPAPAGTPEVPGGTAAVAPAASTPDAPTPPTSPADLRTGRYGGNFANIGMGLNRYVDAIMSMDTGGLDRATVQNQFGQMLRQHGSPLDAVSAMFTGQPMSEANPAGAAYAQQLVQNLETRGAAAAPSQPASPGAPAAAPPTSAPQAPAPTGPRTVSQVFAGASEVEQAEILALVQQGKTDDAMKRLREIDDGQKVTGENAARVAMIQTGLGGLPRARDVYGRSWTAGDWGQAIAGGGTALWDFPGLSGEMGMARRDVNIMVESVLRAMTGAAAPASEVAQYSALFMPSATDSVGSAKQKLDRLETFAQRYITLLQVGRVDHVDRETAQRRLRELANGASVDRLLPGQPSGTQAPPSSGGGGYRVIGVR